MSGHDHVRPEVLFSVMEAERKQEAYARGRREWARATGRPYPGDEETADLRPPPGEVDNMQMMGPG